MARIIILTEGKTNPYDAKTATGVLRYRPQDVVAVLDSTCTGRRAEELLDVGGDIPVVASLDAVEADALLIGIAPAGGGLPAAWRSLIAAALRRRMEVINGLHFFIGDDPEFHDLARRHGAKIYDVRKPPPGLTVAKNLAREAPCFRVHTVGHDCGVGKMLVAIELTQAVRDRGHTAEFLATGQTGIMIAGKGLPIDAIVSDFVAGATESLVLADQDKEFVFIEGQGSLVHPLYSGVTLGLLHGCSPQAMVMCYDASRTEVRNCGMPMPPLEEIIAIYERMASLLCPSRVVAVAANTSRLGDQEARDEVRRMERRVAVPCTDVIRFGCAPLTEAVLAARAAART
jgi:uncharacterized NAD-dependent epimerase/dehydratase family protein